MIISIIALVFLAMLILLWISSDGVHREVAIVYTNEHGRAKIELSDALLYRISSENNNIGMHPIEVSGLDPLKKHIVLIEYKEGTVTFRITD